MNLGSYLHSRWQASPPLNELLPVEKVMTGLYFAADPGSSYATIMLPGGTVEGYANDGSSVDNVTVRFQIHDADYDHGGAMVRHAVGHLRPLRFRALRERSRTLHAKDRNAPGNTGSAHRPMGLDRGFQVPGLPGRRNPAT